MHATVRNRMGLARMRGTEGDCRLQQRTKSQKFEVLRKEAVVKCPQYVIGFHTLTM